MATPGSVLREHPSMIPALADGGLRFPCPVATPYITRYRRNVEDAGPRGKRIVHGIFCRLPTRFRQRSECLYSTLFYPLMKDMTKTCGNCGNASLDDQAQFCNRCGAAVPDKPKTPFPVCPACGAVVSDSEAQFCNRCGTKIPPPPLVCSACGVQALDDQSRFCTRCGSLVQPRAQPRNLTCQVCGAPDPGNNSVFCNRCGAPLNRQDSLPVRDDPAPVIVSQKRTTPAAPEVTAFQGGDVQSREKVYASLKSPVASRSPGDAADFQGAGPQRKYGHLPLVSEELRGKETPAPMHQDPDQGSSSGKSPRKQKKGVLGFLKK